MPNSYDAIDLQWTDEDDFSLEMGDIRDTSSDPLRSIEQEITTRLKSRVGDWVSDPHLGADLDDFIGEPNTKSLAKDIDLQIRSSLTADGLVAMRDLDITSLPMDVHSILFRLKLRASTLANTDGLTINVAYNTGTTGVRILR